MGTMGRDRLLVLDPCASQRDWITACLQRAGWLVWNLDSGLHARAAIASRRVDGLILGQYVPDLPALDLITFSRHRVPTLPILFLVNSDPGGRDEAAALDRGASATLRHPFSCIGLLAACLRLFPTENVDPSCESLVLEFLHNSESKRTHS